MTDIVLAPEGKKEAVRTARALKGINIDVAYCSELKRAKETWTEMKKVLQLGKMPTTCSVALNERDYGIYTGKNKWEIQKSVGEKKFQRIRRAWNEPIPRGETLKDVYARIVPFYTSTILRDLRTGKNVIVVAHGNSLRALVKYLEKLSAKEIASVEIGIAEAHIYKVNPSGAIVGKEVRAANLKRGKI